MTIQDAQKIRAEQLEILKIMLSSEAYNALFTEVIRRDMMLKKTDDGYAVFRGASMNEFATNWARAKWREGR